MRLRKKNIMGSDPWHRDSTAFKQYQKGIRQSKAAAARTTPNGGARAAAAAEPTAPQARTASAFRLACPRARSAPKHGAPPVTNRTHPLMANCRFERETKRSGFRPIRVGLDQPKKWRLRLKRGPEASWLTKLGRDSGPPPRGPALSPRPQAPCVARLRPPLALPPLAPSWTSGHPANPAPRGLQPPLRPTQRVHFNLCRLATGMYITVLYCVACRVSRNTVLYSTVYSTALV